MPKYRVTSVIIASALLGAAGISVARAQPSSPAGQPAQPAIQCTAWQRLPSGDWMALVSTKVGSHSFSAGATVSNGDVMIGKKSLTDLLDDKCPGR